MSTQYRFYSPIQVRYADTDGQGHVFFGNYFTYFDEAISAYFKAIGFPWEKLLPLGLDIFYVEACCQYKGPARFQDILHVYARAARVGNTSLTIETTIYKQDDEQLIANGHVTVVVVDPKTRQPMRVPDELRQALSFYEGHLER